MLFKSLLSSLFGFIVGNVIGIVRSSQSSVQPIWVSDEYRNYAPKSSFWYAVGFGLFFIFFSLPWFTFIPDDVFAQLIASVFLAVGYWIVIGLPSFFTKIYLFSDLIEVRRWNQIVATIPQSSVVAVIQERKSLQRSTVLFLVHGRYDVLNSFGSNFSIPTDVFVSNLNTQSSEVDSLESIWHKDDDVSTSDRVLAAVMTLLNPVTAMMLYLVLFGPFVTVLHGLIILEIVSIMYAYFTKYFRNKYMKRVHLGVPLRDANGNSRILT